MGKIFCAKSDKITTRNSSTEHTERNCNAHIGGIIRIKIIILKFTYMSPTIANESG